MYDRTVWDGLRKELLAANTAERFDEVIRKCEIQRSRDMSAMLERALSKLEQIRELDKRGVDVFRGKPNAVATQILEFVLNG